MTTESEGRLDEEIAQLRERLESAEEMRRAIVADQVDAFVVGDEPQRIVLLQRSNVEPQSLIEHLPHSIVTVSRDGTVLYANHRFAELVGRPLVRLFSASMLEFVAPDHREAFARFVAASEPDSSVRIDVVHAQGDHVAARARVVAVGHGYASLLIVDDDAGARGDAEHALQAIANGNIDGVVVGGEHVMLLAEAQRPYRALVDRMQQGAVTVSSDGDVLYANERFAEMVGRPRETLLGQRLQAVLGTAAIDPLLEDRDDAVVEVTLTREDGSPLPLRIAAECVDGVDARTLIVEDLTERERHRAMQERARRNDHFLAVLAHELRNPLGSIRNAGAILARSNLAQRDRTALGVIERQSETLVRLVDDLLDVHRLNEGKMVLQRQCLAIPTAIHDAVGAVAANLSTKGQTIDVQLPGETLYIDGDSVRIAQVLTNLLLNASKFTGKAGRIAVVAERGSNDGTPTVRVSVTDNGIGLAPDQLERIFEPYVQASADAAAFPEGLGLGLSVARRLINLHGGTIHARSEGSDRGSTFVVELPLCDPSAQAVVTANGEQRDARRARIVIADDDRDSALTLSSLLELMGHETFSTHDGESAIALADQVEPDVVILDIQMPKVDGYTAARTLRERPWADNVLLYALTGWGEPTDAQRMRGARFDRYFVKPVSIDTLAAELARDLLQRSPSAAMPREAAGARFERTHEDASRPGA